MASVKAVTPIEHGTEDGSIKLFSVGDDLTEADFGEDGIRALIAGGSAVEIGKGRKYTAEPVAGVGGAADTDTVKRDDLLRQALMADTETPDPAAGNAETLATSEGQKSTVEVKAEGNAASESKGK